MLSKDHSAEFKRRFADRYADGATVAMPQRELGLTKPTARLWRKGPASEETLGQRCARLEMEAGILKRMAASATDISAAGGSTRW